MSFKVDSMYAEALANWALLLNCETKVGQMVTNLQTNRETRKIGDLQEPRIIGAAKITEGQEKQWVENIERDVFPKYNLDRRDLLRGTFKYITMGAVFGLLMTLSERTGYWQAYQEVRAAAPPGVTLAPDWIDYASLTSDPSLSAGRAWFRSDVRQIVYSPDGVVARYLSPEQSANYLVFIDAADSNKIKARNGLTGAIDYSGTDAATVIQAALNALNTAGNGGSVFIREGQYFISKTLTVYSGLSIEGVRSSGFTYAGTSSTACGLYAGGTTLYNLNNDVSYTSTVDCFVATSINPSLTIRNLRLEGFRKAIALGSQDNYASKLDLENIEAYGCVVGFEITNLYRSLLVNLYAHSCQTGLHIINNFLNWNAGNSVITYPKVGGYVAADLAGIIIENTNRTGNGMMNLLTINHPEVILSGLTTPTAAIKLNGYSGNPLAFITITDTDLEGTSLTAGISASYVSSSYFTSHYVSNSVPFFTGSTVNRSVITEIQSGSGGITLTASTGNEIHELGGNPLSIAYSGQNKVITANSNGSDVWNTDLDFTAATKYPNLVGVSASTQANPTYAKIKVGGVVKRILCWDDA